MAKVFVKPAPGRAVPLPTGGGLLSEAGQPVEWDIFWERRRRDEDIVVVPLEDHPPRSPARGRPTPDGGSAA